MKCVIIYQDFFLVNARDWSIFIMCNKIFSLTNLLGLVSGVPAIEIIKLDLSRSQPDKKITRPKISETSILQSININSIICLLHFCRRPLTNKTHYYDCAEHIVATSQHSIYKSGHNSLFRQSMLPTAKAQWNLFFCLCVEDKLLSHWCKAFGIETMKTELSGARAMSPICCPMLSCLLITRRVSHNFADRYPLKHSVLSNCQDFEELELQCFLSPLFIWDLAENLSASI